MLAKGCQLNRNMVFDEVTVDIDANCLIAECIDMMLVSLYQYFRCFMMDIYYLYKIFYI